MANKPQTEQEHSDETTPVDPEAEAAAATEAVEGDDLPEEPSDTMQVTPTGMNDPEPQSEAQSESPEQQTMELPPALQDAGLKGVIGVTSGQYTLPSGTSFAISPGNAYAVSPEDATALIEQGAGVALEDVQPPS